MALPQIIINVENGALGGVAFTSDGVAGMILSAGNAPSGLELNNAKKIFSVKDAEALGIDAAYDAVNGVHAYRNVAEFYTEGGNGLPLWIMMVANTEMMEEICDKASVNKLAKKLLDAAGGEIRILGISRKPDDAYAPKFTKGLDDDAYNAVVKLHSLLADYESAAIPVVGVVEGREFQGDAAALENLRAASFNRAAVVIASGENAYDEVAKAHDKSASIGLILGRLARDPVMRKCSRKKSGAVAVTQAYLSDGSKVDEFAALGDIHDKGYIAMRTFNGSTGFFFTGDPTATAVTDDYLFISRRRVINKLIMIAYQVYVNEIDDDILVTDEGKIHPGLIKTWEGNINNSVKEQMLANDEISGFTSYIDPDQNVISTNKMNVVLRAIPVGYSSDIEISIGFVNPALG